MKERAQAAIPALALGTVVAADHWNIGPDDFGVVYHCPAHALHIYDYDAVIRIGRAEYRLRPGDVTFTPRREPSRYRLSVKGWHWCIHFRMASVRGARLPVAPYLHTGAERGRVTEWFKEVVRCHHRPAASKDEALLNRARASLALQALLLWWAQRSGGEKERRVTHRVEAALNTLLTLIEEGLAEPLHVPDLADAVGISQNYLARFFRDRFGMTVQRYIAQRRMDKARHLLSTTALPVKSVALQAGVPDVQHFNKLFRRHEGQSPTAFRDTGRARNGNDVSP